MMCLCGILIYNRLVRLKFRFVNLVKIIKIFYRKGLLIKLDFVNLKCIGQSGQLCVWGLTFKRAAIESLFFVNLLFINFLFYSYYNSNSCFENLILELSLVLLNITGNPVSNF